MLVDVATCDLCHKPMDWYESVNGAPMPVDPIPSLYGNVVLEDGRARVLTKKEMLSYEMPSLFGEEHPVRYTSHFATCEFADEFRRCRKCRKSPCLCAKAAK